MVGAVTGCARGCLVPDPDPGPLRARDVAVAAAFALASFALYLALGQRGLYGDGAEFMVLLHEGAPGHKNHLAYLPMLRAAAAVGEVFGWSPWLAARMLSQAGAAVGVGLLHLAGRRFGLRPPQAFWTTALVASTPSIAFFAGIVEVHAPYFAFVGLAWLATAHLARAPSPGRGALLGLATGIAYLGHASGLILPGPLLLVAWHAAAARRRLLPAAVACALVHAAVAGGIPWLASFAGHVASPAGAVRFAGWWKVEIFARPSAALLVLLDEWLLAYLPVSLLWLRAFAAARGSALVATLALAPYLALSLAFLAVYREFGAYCQAVVWLFAWLVVRCFSRPVLVAAVAIGLVTGTAKVLATDRSAAVERYAEGVRTAAAGAEPLLIVGDFPDFEFCFVAAPGTPFVNLAAAAFAANDTVGAAIRDLDERIAAHLARGGRVFLTEGAVGLLGAANAGPGFAAVLAHLQARYRRALVTTDGFRAFELTANG